MQDFGTYKQASVEVGALKLTEVLGLEILQKIQDGFAASYGIPAIIYGPDGTPITEPSQFTDFCKFVRSTPKGNKNCKAFDAKLMKILSKKPEPYIRKGCALKNIITGTVPIVIQGHHLANFGIGQMIDEDFDFDEIKRYAREIGVDENDLLEAAKTLIPASKEKFESAVRFLNILAEQLSLLGLQNLYQARFIAELEQAEEALKNYSERMEDMVKERTQELEATQEELVKHEKLSVLGQLTATVSHELRNPLGVIQSSAFYLINNTKDSDEKNRKHLKRIDEQVGLCDKIIGDLMEYTRGRRSKMFKGDLNTWLEEVLAGMTFPEPVHMLREMAPDLPKVRFDREKLQRAVTI